VSINKLGAVMEQVSFYTKIVALREEWLLHKSDDLNSPDFWYIMNSISEEEAIKWTTRLLQLNFSASEFYNSMTYDRLHVDDLIQLQSVVYDYTSKEKKDIFYEGSYHKLTRSQKFLLIFKLIKHWEHLELAYMI
jgi:hypothetical protein